jgi:coenzyme PQQ precursor peptide PqqA
MMCFASTPVSDYISLAVIEKPRTEDPIMTWATPTLEEICIGLEINGYLPAEF